LSAPLRIVSPSPAQLQADDEALYLAYFGGDVGMVVLATSACGLGLTVHDGVARVAASERQLGSLAEELERRGAASAAHLRRFLTPERAWKLRRRELELDRPHIMGILNLTEDSFSGDGVGKDVQGALEQADRLRAAGADIIDVGAETARADRPVMDPAIEAALVAGVVAALTQAGHIVSVDTYKGEVARAALVAGAEIVNDISGLTAGTGAAEEAARAGAGYVLNYSYSVPKRRPEHPPRYGDVVAETVAWMFERVERLRGCGLQDAQIAIDPGIAFGKSHDEDLQMLRRIGELRTLGLPVLLAHSRKNFIGSVSGRSPDDRDLETHVASALALEQGAKIFRVHDVEGARRALEMSRAIHAGKRGDFAPGDGSWPWRAGASASHMRGVAADKAAPDGQRW
jgi:dihydropteroate synthase